MARKKSDEPFDPLDLLEEDEAAGGASSMPVFDIDEFLEDAERDEKAHVRSGAAKASGTKRKKGRGASATEWIILAGEAVASAQEAIQVTPLSKAICNGFYMNAMAALEGTQKRFSRENARATIYRAGAAWGCAETVVRLQERAGKGGDARARLDRVNRRWLRRAEGLGLDPRDQAAKERSAAVIKKPGEI